MSTFIVALSSSNPFPGLFFTLAFLFLIFLPSITMSIFEITPSKISIPSNKVNSNQMMGDLQNVRASYRLNEKNYLKWSQFIKTYLKGKGRLSHILRIRPKKGDSMFEEWEKHDSMIIMVVGLNGSCN